MERAEWRAVNVDLEAAIASVAKKHDINLKTDGFRFNETECTFKIQASVKKLNGKRFNVAKEEFKKHAWRFGLTGNEYGKTYTKKGFFAGTYKVIGINTRAKGYPVEVENQNGKQYKLTVEQLKKMKELA